MNKIIDFVINPRFKYYSGCEVDNVPLQEVKKNIVPNEDIPFPDIVSDRVVIESVDPTALIDDAVVLQVEPIVHADACGGLKLTKIDNSELELEDLDAMAFPGLYEDRYVPDDNYLWVGQEGWEKAWNVVVPQSVKTIQSLETLVKHDFDPVPLEEESVAKDKEFEMVEVDDDKGRRYFIDVKNQLGVLPSDAFQLGKLMFADKQTSRKEFSRHAFLCSLKHDGTRMMCKIFEHSILLWNRAGLFFSLDYEITGTGSIVDCELVGNTLILLDVLYFMGEDIRSRNFNDRKTYFSFIQGDNLVHQKFAPVEKLSELECRPCHDGIVFTRLFSKYVAGDNSSVFFWKYVDGHSADFYCGVVPSRKKGLFTSCEKGVVLYEYFEFPDNLMNRVCEFIWVQGKWKFKRMRFDKSRPNSHAVVKNVESAASMAYGRTDVDEWVTMCKSSLIK